MVASVDAGGTFPLLAVAVVAGELNFLGVEGSKAICEGEYRGKCFKGGGYFIAGVPITIK